MAWQESKFWLDGAENMLKYQETLHEALTADERNSKRKKVVHPNEMPWELAPQGILKHLINEQMNTRMETVDAYMQIIPPGVAQGNTDTSLKSACMCSRAMVTTFIKTVTWRSRIRITGRPKTRSRSLSGKPET